MYPFLYWNIPFDDLIFKYERFLTFIDRLSAKRENRWKDAAKRLVFLAQFYMVIIDHIYQNELHGPWIMGAHAD